MSDQKVSDTLKLLEHDPSQRLTPDTAREVCLRTNRRVMVLPAVSRIGTRYVLTLKAGACGSGETLTSIEVEAADHDQVRSALKQATAQLSERLAATLPSVPSANPPLPDNVTGTLAAVQAYAQGENLSREGTQAIPYCKRAIALDPDCAMAYIGLANMYHSAGDLRSADENFSQAYQLRTRVSAVERAIIEGEYYFRVTGDLDRAATAFQELTRLIPDDPQPHLTLAAIYNTRGEFEKGAQEARAATRISEASGGPPLGFRPLLRAYMGMGQLDQAKAVVADAKRHQQEAPLFALEYFLDFLQHDTEAMGKLVRDAMGGENESGALFLQSMTEQYYGHMKKARELNALAVQSVRHLGVSTAASYQLEQAMGEAEVGNTTWARQHVPNVSPRELWANTGFTAAYVLARAGDAHRAQQMVELTDREFPFNTRMQRCWLPAARAAIALDSNDAERALRELMTATPCDLDFEMIPVYMHGVAYLRAHQASQAAAEFQKIADHPANAGNVVYFPLAWLQLGRAQVMMGGNAAARSSYQQFFAIWKGADPDIPIYKEAKLEYAKLQ